MDYSSRNGLHNFSLTLASRRAEEAAWRRYEAVRWLESFVGPLGLPTQPSEMEFISCLRNGLVLCNAINKIQPGSIPKVVDNPWPLQSLTWECQPLPAYQYFENVRNFLVAAKELNLPAFEASDLERDTFEAKVVDCVLALKSLHESKQMSNENGFHKHVKSSPLVLPSAKKTLPRPLSTVSLGSCRRLDMSAMSEKQPPVGSENAELEDLIVKSLVDCLVQEKENFDGDLLVSLRNGDKDPVRLFQRVVSICSDKSLQESFSEKFDTGLKDELKERSSFLARSDIVLDDITTTLDNSQKRCKACYKKKSCNHGELFCTQEKELLDLKALLSKTKVEFYDLQSQLQRDLKDLENQVQELSNAALGYHNVVHENRSLYNMVQDLKGNIRVYCRIRPSFNCSSKDVIEFIGEDGSLMLLDPLKPKKYGRKVFRFNRVFGPAAKQDDVFKDIQPLIRSVMDGYNVCVFAYGQTGSGKTHTMNGPSGGADKDFGINYLALNDLFQIQNVRKDIDYEINVQMVEIYNEQVRDLLVAESSITKLEIRSCTSDTGLSLPDATRHSVKSTADVLNLIKLGELNRAVSFTSMNNQSSRSHSILTVYVHGKDNSGSSIRSCLHLVDLAGSERIDKSEVTGDRLKEAQYINKSLSCLGDVIMALAQKNSHIPYRNSKLTLLLQDSLGGHAKTVMFAHVSPEEDSFSETLSTLKFAQNVSTVELGSARLNKESSEVVQLKAQVENLKKALANNEVEGASNKSKAPRSPRQVAERTPPRPRRLSIENCSSAKTELLSKEEMGKGSKTPSIRTRRSSLEGPKCINNDGLSTKLLEDGSKNQALTFQKCGIIQNSVPISRVSHSISNGTVALEMNHKAPTQSPQGASYMKRTIDIKGTRIPSLQVPKTPEPPKHVRNDIQNQMQSDAMFPTDAQTPNLNSTASGKGSRIRRSMRTIGKLINGSEKRNRQNVKELHTPMQATSTCNINLDISPLTTNSRMQRRQSLTGIQMTGSNTSRRSSLGGKPTDSNVQKVLDNTRNARTPPPIRQSTQVTKRWM